MVSASRSQRRGSGSSRGRQASRSAWSLARRPGALWSSWTSGRRKRTPSRTQRMSSRGRVMRGSRQRVGGPGHRAQAALVGLPDMQPGRHVRVELGNVSAGDARVKVAVWSRDPGEGLDRPAAGDPPGALIAVHELGSIPRSQMPPGSVQPRVVLLRHGVNANRTLKCRDRVRSL